VRKKGKTEIHIKQVLHVSKLFIQHSTNIEAFKCEKILNKT